MNSVMADFVGLLGPGQIVDRQALVAVPTGLVKIIICNTINNLCLLVSEFKENLNSTGPSIKVSVKAFLGVGDDVINGVFVPTDQSPTGYGGRNLQLFTFDKTLPRQGEVVAESNCGEGYVQEEILQICVYATRNRSKHLLGFVHISLPDVQFSCRHSTNVEAWYKVFPSSSFLYGHPMISRGLHHINSSFDSTIPTSPVPADILNWVGPITRDFFTFSSSASGSSADIPIKRNSFRNVAKSLAKLLRKRGSTSSMTSSVRSAGEEASTSAFHESFMISSNNNLSKRPKSWSVFNEKQGTNSEGGNRSSGRRKEAARNFFRLNIGRSFYEKSSAKSHFIRCEEIICSSPVENRRFWESSADHEFGFNESTRTRATFGEKPSSIGTESGDISSVEIEEFYPHHQQQRQTSSIKVNPSVLSWAQRVQKKAKFRSQPHRSSRQSDDVFDIADHDNVYDVLKYLKTLPKTSTSENRSAATDLSNNDVVNSSVCSNKCIQEKVATQHPGAPADEQCYQSEVIDNEKCFCDSMECQQKREKFAQNRAVAVAGDTKQGELLLSLATQRLSVSDDDYATCSERLSSTNLSLISCYTTASEQ